RPQGGGGVSAGPSTMLRMVPLPWRTPGEDR
ncbi:MAG: hypothetical protein JWO81_951, partial [Alphaproteobacteria bacterium]|nr:hypothetical protein [Alphaproteobacteria bacterium]